jgi:hypothetical protein
VLADVSREIPVPGRIDGVLHFASPASPPEYLEMPLETMDVGSSTRNVSTSHANDARFLVAPTTRLRRPARAPADRGLQRYRTPPARGVRRSEALRRDADDDVPPAVCVDTGSSASSTRTDRLSRRGRAVELLNRRPKASRSRSTATVADAVLLLCRRRGARSVALFDSDVVIL